MDLSRDEQIQGEKKARMAIDRDEYARKVHVQNVQAFNRYVIHQNSIKKKQNGLIKRAAQLESLAHSVDTFPVQGALVNSLNLTSPKFNQASPSNDTTAASTAPPTLSHMHRAL